MLAWAAHVNRVLLTHDVSTITEYAYHRVREGLTMPGVIAMPTGLSVGEAVDDLALIEECGEPSEWKGQVRYLPLR